MLKKVLAIILCASLLLCLGACSKKDSEKKDETESLVKNEETQTQEADNSQLYQNSIKFTIELENGGVMKGEVYPNLAPETVKNFTKLVNEHFYDGLIFHRVIKDMMIQGGGYDKDMNPKESGTTIKGEFESNGFKNDLKHTRGVISMARTKVPDSASSQFFIVHQDTPYWDGQYAAFGRITEGIDIVDEIATCETGVYQPYNMSDVPVEPVIIKTITLN